MHAVSQAILDVAFSAQSPTIALNIVHPRPVQWSEIMHSISDALLEAKILSQRLALVPFSEWFDRLETRSREAGGQDLNSIVSAYLLVFLHHYLF